MLWVIAMKLHRLALPSFAALVPLLAACEPSYDMAPPQTAQSAENAQQDDSQAQQGTEPAATSADANGQYASQEYAIGAETDAYDDNDPSAVTDFKPVLAPYGTWTDDPTYGTVW